MSVHQSERMLQELGVPPEQVYLLLRSAGYNPSRAIDMWYARQEESQPTLSAAQEELAAPHGLPVAQAGLAAPRGAPVAQAELATQSIALATGTAGPPEVGRHAEADEEEFEAWEFDDMHDAAALTQSPQKARPVEHSSEAAKQDEQPTDNSYEVLGDRGAYYTQLAQVLVTARREHARLLLDEERDWIDLLLPDPRSAGETSEDTPTTSSSTSALSPLSSAAPVSTKAPLTLSAQVLYARLFCGRKGGWLRFSSLFNYHEVFGPVSFEEDCLTEKSGDSEKGEFSETMRYTLLQEAIEELIAARLVESARPSAQSSNGSLDVCSRAAVNDSPLGILLFPEAKALAARYKIKPPKKASKSGGGSGGGGGGSSHRDDLLEAIANHLTTTRTISFFGGSVGGSVPYLTHMHSLLADTLVARSQDSSFLAPRPGGTIWKRARKANSEGGGGTVEIGDVVEEGNVPGHVVSQTSLKAAVLGLEERTVKCGHLVIRLAGKPRALLRRLLRVINLTTRSSVTSDSGDGDDEGAIGMLDEGPTALMSNGLMQSFGLLQFAPYEMHRSFRVFRDRRALLLWEAAVELRHEMHRRLYEWESGKLWVVENKSSCAPAPGPKEVEQEDFKAQQQRQDAKRQRRHKSEVVTEFSREAEVITVEDDEDDRGEEAEERCGAERELRRLLLGAEANASASTSETSKGWEASSREVIDVVRLAFIARAAADVYLSTDDANSEIMPLPSAKGPLVRLPTWLENMSAFAVLVSIVGRGVKPLEQIGRYGEAVELLEWLLKATVIEQRAVDFFPCVAPHRRGQWHIRLAIDLQHAYKHNKKGSSSSSGASSNNNQAVHSVLLAARADPWVRGGDRLDVLKRVAKLSAPSVGRQDAGAESKIALKTNLRGKSGPSTEGWDANMIEEWLNESGASLVGSSKKLDRGMFASFLPEVDVVRSRRLNREVGVKSRFVGLSEFEDSVGVEQLAMQHYSQKPEITSGGSGGSRTEEVLGGGWGGLHSEGSQVHELFALLMWGVLFAPVPDVFQTPFQAAPLDLDCASYPTAHDADATEARRLAGGGTSSPAMVPCACFGFYAARAQSIDARLAELRGLAPSELAQQVADAWLVNRGSAVCGLDWRPGKHTPLGLLQAMAACTGGAVLAAMFRTLAVDHRHFSAGLPDLLLIRALRPSGDSWEVAETLSWLAPSIAMRLDPFVARLRRKRRVDEEDLKGEASESVRDELAAMEDDDKPITLPPGWRFEARLVEVKGPSDTLSFLQRAWLVIIGAAGGHCRVCRVVDSGKSAAEAEISD